MNLKQTWERVKERLCPTVFRFPFISNKKEREVVEEGTKIILYKARGIPCPGLSPFPDPFVRKLHNEEFAALAIAAANHEDKKWRRTMKKNVEKKPEFPRPHVSCKDMTKRTSSWGRSDGGVSHHDLMVGYLQRITEAVELLCELNKLKKPERQEDAKKRPGK